MTVRQKSSDAYDKAEGGERCGEESRVEVRGVHLYTICVRMEAVDQSERQVWGKVWR